MSFAPAPIKKVLQLRDGTNATLKNAEQTVSGWIGEGKQYWQLGNDALQGARAARREVKGAVRQGAAWVRDQVVETFGYGSQ